MPKVSLDGKRIAFRAEIDDVDYLALMELSTLELKLVAKFETTELLNIFWKGDDFLLLLVSNSQRTMAEFRSFDLKTQQVRFLGDKMYFKWATLLSILSDDPDQVVVEVESVNGTYLARLNLRTGSSQVVEKASSKVVHWYVNRRGEAIASLWNDDKKYFLRTRNGTTGSWQQVEIGPEEPPRKLRPFGVHFDQQRLLAWDDSEPGPTRIVALDPVTLAKEVIFKHPEVEPQSMRYWGEDPTALIAIAYEEEITRFAFLDPEAAKMQAMIDASLPDMINDVRSASLDRSVAVFLSSSARDPGTYYMLDRTNRKLVTIAPLLPTRDPASMGNSQLFRFKSKDGLPIRGRLFLPPGSPERPPLLVMVGSELAGPSLNGGYHGNVQMFVSRGYAVAKIDYRGTSGYGWDFLKAGNYQFGTGMVDDLYAGIDHLVQRGLVDGDRLGLFTTFRGGPVGLQALTRNHRFKIWLNQDTTFAGSFLEADDLALFFRKPQEVQSDLGGKAGVRALLDTLDAKETLARVNLPTFHVYRRESTHGINRSSTFIKDHLGANTPREIVNFDRSTDKKFTQAEYSQAMEKMFAFLAKWLPPLAPAR